MSSCVAIDLNTVSCCNVVSSNIILCQLKISVSMTMLYGEIKYYMNDILMNYRHYTDSSYYLFHSPSAADFGRE